MTRKMTVGAAATAFFGTILAASATSVAGVAWNAETTNDWFTASTTSTNTWIVPSSGTASVEGGDTIVFDTEVSDSLKYDPADSGPVALVNVQMIVDPNATLPTTDGLSEAQAALSVVTNNAGYLEWVGLVKDGATNKWVTLSGDRPTVGDTYAVQIAVDNRSGYRKIRYAVSSDSGATYTILNAGSVEWLENPKSDKTGVDKVAFAGAGTIKSLVGKNIVEVGPSITVNPFDNSQAYDFTNGTMTAVVTIPSGDYSEGKTAVLTITNLRTGDEHGFDPVNVTDSTVPINLSGLTAGDMYSYTVSVKYDGVERAVKAGTFVAANWSSDCLFGGTVSGSTANVTNGVMSGAVAADSKWSVVTNAQFKVDDTAAGAGKVTRVDTAYSFETFIDTDSLETLPDAVGGIVAVSNGADPAWYAYTGTNPSELNGWLKLTGDIVPATNTDYVIRAEFDFKSPTHGVCYYVAVGNSGSFCPLTLGGDIMIDLAKTTNTLSSVEMSGKGFVKSICANIADPSVAEVNDVKYTSLWDAVKNAGNNPIKLLTNATLAPSGVTGGKYPFRLTGDFSFILDKSGVPGAWKVVEKNGVLYLMKPAATYIFF